MFFPEIFSRSSFWSLSFDHGVNIIVDMSSYCENNSSTSCRSTGDTLPGSSIKPQIVPVTNAACDRYFVSYFVPGIWYHTDRDDHSGRGWLSPLFG